jgi:hypothetical protein
MWSQTGPNYYYSATALNDCKSLGLDAYVLKLQWEPKIHEPQNKDFPIACSWGGIGAYVNGPVNFAAKKFTAWITWGNPDYVTDTGPHYVGSLGVGTDSALLSNTNSRGDRSYSAMAKTANASYIVNVLGEREGNESVTDAYYSAAITEMLKTMIAKRPETRPAVTLGPLTG